MIVKHRCFSFFVILFFLALDFTSRRLLVEMPTVETQMASAQSYSL